MSSIAWDTVRDAIRSWITTGSGLSGDHVIWSAQRDANGNPMPRPSGMYIAMRFTLLQWNGITDWQDNSYDEGSNTFTRSLRGPRKATLTATCYEGMPTGGSGSPSSAGFSMGILNDAMQASDRDDIEQALTAAGVGVGSIEQLSVAGGTFNDARFEGRSIVTVGIHLASEVDYTYPTGTGWIEFVNASGITPGDLSTIHFTAGT